MNMQQNPDGSWTPAQPLPYYGWKARLAAKLLRKGLDKIAKFFVWLDERKLGR